MTKTLQHLLLCNVTEKNYKICRRRPEHAFDIHLPLGFLVYRVSSNFIQEYLSFSKQFSNWVCTLMTMLQPGSFPIRLNLSHQYILVVLDGLIVKSCPTLCDPMNCSPPASSIHGILQARILEWVAISCSRGPSWSRDQTQVSSTAGRFFTNWAP